jgi:hypothetical protein
MQPRIYTYKITFEEIPHWYWGVHKEKKYGETYLGSPVTHKWMWDFYTPKIQILEFFPFTDEGWKEANLVEDRLIRPDLNNPLCLNEGCGARVSREAAQQGGYKMKGVPKTKEHREKIGNGNRGKKRSPEYCQALSERNKGRSPTEEQKLKQSESLKRFFKENPEVRTRIAEKAKERKWFHNPLTGETRHCTEIPAGGWQTGRPISYLGAPWWTDGTHNKRAFECPGPGWERGMTSDPRRRKFKCTVTGFISSPGGLTKYQKLRGIDLSNRVLVE